MVQLTETALRQQMLVRALNVVQPNSHRLGGLLMTITFGSISIAGSGMRPIKRLDAIADNIANINTITATDDVPFKRVLRCRPASLKQASQASMLSTPQSPRNDGRLVYDPSHPLQTATDLSLRHQ